MRNWRDWPLVGFVLSLIGMAIVFRPLWPFGNNQLWADNFDGYLVVWILEWGHHILFEAKNFADFWQANSFYPHPNALAYSESLLSAQLIYGPLRELGVGSLTAMYAAFALTTLLATCLSDLALIRLNVRPLERALCLLVFHFSMPIVTFLYHYQLFAFHFAAPFFAWLYLYLTRFRNSSFHIVLITFVFASCYSTYLVIALPIASVPMIGWLCWRRVRTVGWRSFLVDDVRIGSKIAWIAFYVTFLYVVCLHAYLSTSKGVALPGYEEIKIYSARPSSLFKGKSMHSYWYSPEGYSNGGWERAYFPGYILLVLSFGAIFGGLWCRLKKNLTKIPLPSDLIVIASLLFVWLYVLSLGPFLHGTDIPLPYWFVSKAFPAFRNVRTPGRFGILLCFPMGILCLAMLKSFAGKFGRFYRLAGVVLVLAIAVESLPEFKVYPFVVEGDNDFKALSNKVTKGDPLIVLPSNGGDNMKTILNMTSQLIGTRYYWGRLVAGYGSRSTPELDELIYREQLIADGHHEFESIVDWGKKIGVKYLFIRLNAVNATTRKAWTAYSSRAHPEFEIIGSNVLLKL